MNHRDAKNAEKVEEAISVPPNGYPGNLVIRRMIEGDIERLAMAFASWNKPRAQYERYWAENGQGSRVTFVALVDGAVAGYTNVLWCSAYEPFRREGIPEINDLNVLGPYRRRGIATALITACEDLAREAGKPVMGIGVGVPADYDAARRLYPKLGYTYDGRGITPDAWGGAEFLTKALR
jgi:GNAT superfamily N-acetyltransferase